MNFVQEQLTRNMDVDNSILTACLILQSINTLSISDSELELNVVRKWWHGSQYLLQSVQQPLGSLSCLRIGLGRAVTLVRAKITLHLNFESILIFIADKYTEATSPSIICVK